jgi:hypothetical protein
VAFILFDAGFLVLDAARLAFNRCSFLEKDLQRQFAIDAGVLALDLVCLEVNTVRFSLHFIEKENWDIEVSQDHTLVEITIGNFNERFETSLEFWSIGDYQNQWKDALEGVLAGQKKTCLLTSINDPKFANFYFCWPLYREKDHIYVQNSLLFLDEIKEPFDLSNPHQYVHDRETVSEEGYRISEWEVSLADITAFLNELRG